MANLRVDKITSTETFETTGSVQFHQDNDNYLSGTITAIGTQDFTIECWVYLLANRSSQHQRFFGNEDGAFDSNTLNMRFTPNLAIQIYYGDQGDVTSDKLSESTWYHVAMSYSDNIARCYIDGKEFGRITGNTDLGNTTMFIGGTYTVGGENFNGHVSNARLIVGKGIYSENFKPPMRELEVTPETVLLACQSKTDKLEERSGNTTLSATGSLHSASELTPGLLTPVPKAGAGSAITGSVVFDGGDDYLSIPDSEDFYFEDHKFTVELWAYTGTDTTSNRTLFSQWAAGTNRNIQFDLRGDASKVWRFYYRTSSTTEFVSGNDPVEPNSWYHVATVADGTNLKLYVNGILQETNAIAGDAQNSDQALIIGAYSASPEYWWDGYISNLRIVKGTALYTDDFIPPTRELKKVPGTVLLCCQDENSVTTEATGKTISAYGSVTASNFTPQVGDDRKVTFEGVTKINSDAYFYLPTGDTVTRESRYGRGIFMGGYKTSPNAAVGDIHYINIPSMGNSVDFGDLVNAARWAGGSCGSSTRGLYGGGATPTSTDHIDFVTIATTSNALDFGNLATAQGYVKACSNATRGIWGGGRSNNSPVVSSDVIQYITIASTGNAIDFGNLTSARTATGNTASPVRALFGGGYTSPSTTALDVIDYVTIASTGNAVDFGDLLVDVRYSDVASSGIRGLWGGGSAPVTDTIQYVTIASTGNAQNFGDLTASIEHISCTDNSIRGVWGGGVTPTYLNVLQYVTIATTGNAKDFGDLSRPNLAYAGGTSDSHGGLG